jgi:hypothetical protein
MVMGLLSERAVAEVKQDAEKDFSWLRDLKVTSIQDLGIFYDVVPSEDAPAYVESIREGKITVANEVIYLRKGYEQTSLYSSREWLMKFGEYGEYPVITFSFDSQTQTIMSPKLDGDLRALGLLGSSDELGSLWLKMPSLRGYAMNVSLAFPLYFKASGPSMSDATYYFRFRVDRNLKSKLQLMVALRGEAGTPAPLAKENRLFRPENFETLVESKSFVDCQASAAFSSVPSVKDQVYCRVVIPSLGTIHEELNSVENMLRKTEFKDPLLGVFQRLVGADGVQQLLEGKKNLLKPGGNPANEFQRMIQWLLSLAGCKVIELGDTRYGTISRQDKSEIGDIDILAQDLESPTTYAIQCTISPPESRKIDVIANIANELRRAGLLVEPLIFVRDYAGEVKKNTRKVRVADLEDFRKAIQLLSVGNTAEAKKVLLSGRFIG